MISYFAVHPQQFSILSLSTYKPGSVTSNSRMAQNYSISILLQMTRSLKKLTFTMTSYKHNMVDNLVSPTNVLLPGSEQFDQRNSESPLLNTDAKAFFHTKIAQLLYLSSHLHGKLSYYVNRLCQKVNAPTEDDMNKLLHVFGYVKLCVDNIQNQALAIFTIQNIHRCILPALILKVNLVQLCSLAKVPLYAIVKNNILMLNHLLDLSYIIDRHLLSA